MKMQKKVGGPSGGVRSGGVRLDVYKVLIEVIKL